MNPAGLPSRGKELSFPTQPSVELASLTDVLAAYDFSWVLLQTTNKSTGAQRSLSTSYLLPLFIKEKRKSQMAQTPKLAYPSSFTDPELELPEEPRFLFIRVSLDMAQAQDCELRRLAKSPDLTDSQTALAILQSEALAAPKKEPIASCWDHSDASHWLLHASADSEAFFYSPEELYVASVFCAAELQVSRGATMSDLGLNIFGLVAAADKLITGW